MNNEIPVIIYHEGNQDYLRTCIAHTKKYNSRVILIGDDSNKEFCEEWYDASKLEENSRWEEFMNVFENLSFYDDKFSRQIFKRLFLIEVLLKELNIAKFALLDSDILVYINFSETPYVSQYDVGHCTIDQRYEDLRWVTNIGISFFSREALSDFVSFCIDEFKNNKEELNKKWEWHKKTKTGGGVGEMPLAYLWLRKTTFKDINLAVPTDNWGIYDNAIQMSANYYPDEYEMNKFLRVKKVRFINGSPYYITSNTKKMQKVDGLHFAAFSKKYMKSISNHKRYTLSDYIKEFCEKVNRALKG